MIKIGIRFENIGAEVEAVFKVIQLESLDYLLELWALVSAVTYGIALSVIYSF